MGRYSDKIMSSLPVEMKTARLNHELNRTFLDKRIKEKYKMGYRSTVAYTIRFTPIITMESEGDEDVAKCKESFYTFLAEGKLKYGGAFSDESLNVNESNMAINFLAYDVKWYEDYEDVIVHENLISLAKEWADEGETANKNIGGIFMRIGEEMDDMVEESWGEADWDWMRIHRQIEVDWEEAR
jgi:hypothetical protein